MMIVTVGTSLFTSASWKPEGPFSHIDGYSLWATEHDFLGAPAARARMCRATGGTTVAGSTVEAGIENAIRRDSNDAAKYLAPPLDASAASRYSAEIATIVSMWQALSADIVHGVADFLKASYKEIRLLCSSDEDDKSFVAAGQLKAQLATLGQGLGTIVRLENRIEGGSVIEKATSFKAVIDALDSDSAVDFVISGGYKIYAAIVTRLLRGDWRIFYLHEVDAQLVTTDVLAGNVRVSGRNRTLLLGGIAGGHE